MNIVGIEMTDPDAGHVHTIDLWFSDKRQMWIVERLNAEGHLVGTSHQCASEQDAEDCLDEWLRSHSETHLVVPRQRKAIGKAVERPRRRAA